RVGRAERTTRESSIVVEIDLDGTGQTEISTGVPFFDHMLTAFGQHGAFDLTVRATGDVEIEAHHTVEDTAIVLGRALAEALGDVSGRAYCVHSGEPEMMTGYLIVGHDSAPYGTVLNRHVFETLASHARIALHVRVHYGRDPHHITEAEYKAVARALRAAVEPDPRITGVPSTKGAL